MMLLKPHQVIDIELQIDILDLDGSVIFVANWVT